MVNRFLKQFGIFFLLFLINFGQAWADFKVKNIEIEGNKRISYETIYSYLPVAKGELLTSQDVRTAIKTLYATGFFKDINFYQKTPDTLVIKVSERPSISEIKIEGNELIKTEDMKKALDAMGVKKGRIFNSTQMERIIVDLRRRYQNQGYYAADVGIKVIPLPRNRVAIHVKVEEGKPATIGRITLVGNHQYSDKTLKSKMLLSEHVMMGDGDKYAKPKLQSDLETIKSYYMDTGYAEFKERSSQVSLALDKTKVFITINLHEGPQYTVSKIKFSGHLIIGKARLKKLLKIHPQDLFNRSAVIATVNAIRDKLSEEGYAFSEVMPLTKLDKNNHLVSIDFRILPKNRVYVRHIIIEGNTRTRDHVIRRELRQFEKSPYSLKSIKRSNSRLKRLGYFKTAKIETKRVAKDQVDLVVKVEEQSTGSFNAGIGYSQLDGMSFTLGVTERNLVGSGNTLSVKGRYSSATKTLNIGLTNPYFTPDAVSFGGGAYLSEVDASQLGISDYSVNNYGMRTNLGYPLSEESNISYGIKLDNQDLLCSDTFTACKSYVQNYGKHYASAKLSIGWTHDSKNAFYFPSDGSSTNLNASISAPIDESQIAYYQLYAKHTQYIPVTHAISFKLKGDVAYGDGLGQFTGLPFFDRFYAGGIGSVRGYEPNSLGPQYDLLTDGSSSPKGGRFKLVSTAALVFPMPFIDDSSNIRLSLFVDAGNVFGDVKNVKLSEIRASSGLSVSWITPVGPLAFSLAKAFNEQKQDKTQVFQFNLGIPM